MIDTDNDGATVLALASRLGEDQALHDRLQAVVNALGFEFGAYGFLNTLRIQIPMCSNVPDQFKDAYFEAGYHTSDPIISCLASSRRSMYLNDLHSVPSFSRIWIEHAKEFEVGPPEIGIPMYGPFGETSIFVLIGGKVPPYEHEKKKLLRKATKVAHEFHSEIMTTIGADKFLKRPELSDRELTCMMMISRGKVVSEIAEDLKISSRTVESHLSAARERLDCKNTVHAIAKAVHIGLISPD
jgi:DNA-binding CsgD family transcriptional regulator